MKVGYQILADLQQQQAFKQWGNSWSGYTGVFNWYFPISPSQVYAACLTKHTKNISSSHNWEPARVEEWNNSYARIHPDGDLGYSVIAICKAQQQWGKPTVRGNNIFPIPFPNSALAITSAGIGGWHTVDVSIVNNNSYSVLGWATDSPSAARTSLPNVIAIGF